MKVPSDKRISARFVGRSSGSEGKFAVISALLDTTDIDEAIKLIYTHYEHVALPYFYKPDIGLWFNRHGESTMDDIHCIHDQFLDWIDKGWNKY